MVRDGVIVRSFACALEPSKRQRLQGARLVEQEARLNTEPIVVGRRVSRSGDITVGGQRIHLGLTNATKTVEVLVETRYLRVMDQGATIKVVARNTPKEVNRFKATGKAYGS